jgi:predicted nuclease of restriction endonuclease-like (RecB) superfamily
MSSSKQIIATSTALEDTQLHKLITTVIQLIENAKAKVTIHTNSVMVTLYWNVGNTINKEILGEKRAEYGEHVIAKMAVTLTELYGSGFDRPNIFRMLKFSRIFTEEIGVTLSHQLSWSHIIKVMAINDELKREFYIEMCCLEKWGVRVLKQKIDSMFYERTAIAKQPEEIIKSELVKLKQGKVGNPALYLQDPYVLSFLNSKNISTEFDLEQAILDELQAFIQEFGSDFCFVARQKRMSTEKNDRYLDLLFFHRGMRRLIAVELKLSSFQPEHIGQMEWYLKWLNKYERKLGEEQPLGIIICSDKDQEDIELLELDKTGIHVAQYITELPAKEVFQNKLKQAITLAKENYAKRLLSNTNE